MVGRREEGCQLWWVKGCSRLGARDEETLFWPPAGTGEILCSRSSLE